MENPKKKKLFYIRLGTLITIFTITSIYVLDQYCKKIFPDAPYREYFTFHLKERVLKGLVISPIANVLFTKSENIATTKLPVWEIQLSGRKLALLNRDLPSSGRIYQSGTVIINSSPFPARFRFRGDGFWHWKSKQKSWKIELRGDQRFEGKREFNLVNPRSATTLIWPLTFYIAKSMGLKTPRLQHVHARLNGQYLGVLYLVENFDHDFTAQNCLPEGALYQDEALGPYDHQSWEEIDNWNIRLPGEKRKHQAGNNPSERYENHLKELLSCLTLENDEEFFQRLEELVDLSHYLRWWAHATICLDIHQDRKHNNRLYLDPTSAKYRQIPWDMGIQWSKDPHGDVDLDLNPITVRLLQSPEYIHARNGIIWEVIKGPARIDKLTQWLDKTADLIREDIYCDPYKDKLLIAFEPSLLSKKIILSMYLQPVTNGIFEEYLNEMRTFLIKRITYLEKLLSKNDSKLFYYSISSVDVSVPGQYIPVGLINLQIGGQEGIKVKEIRICFNTLPVGRNPFVLYGNSNRLIKKEGKKIQDILPDVGEVYAFQVNELLLPGREKKPPFGPVSVRYPFTVAFTNSKASLPIPVRVEFRGVHPLTNQEILLEAPLSELKADIHTIPIGKFQPISSPPRKIIWSGLKKLNEDFRVEKDEILVIRPGTRIEFTEGTSLLSNGKILALGTVRSPIVFTRAPHCASWGVVALQGSKADGSVFKHCTFEYGSDDELDRVFYSGALSIYNADATIKKCLFHSNQGDDALNTKFSSTDVFQSRFINNKSDAYDIDFSEGRIVENVFESSGNDGIDCGTAHPIIKGNRIFNCGDKGISIGERSNPVVESNLIAHCKVGIAVKDQSCPEIKSNEFLSNDVAVAAYQKKKVFGGAKVTVSESKFHGNKRISESDGLSSVLLMDCVNDGGSY